MDAPREEAKIEGTSPSLSLSLLREENSVSKVSRVMNANSCACYELKRLHQIDPPIEKLLPRLLFSFLSLRSRAKTQSKVLRSRIEHVSEDFDAISPIPFDENGEERRRRNISNEDNVSSAISIRGTAWLQDSYRVLSIFTSNNVQSISKVSVLLKTFLFSTNRELFGEQISYFHRHDSFFTRDTRRTWPLLFVKYSLFEKTKRFLREITSSFSSSSYSVNIAVSIGRISEALGVKKMRDHRRGLETLRGRNAWPRFIAVKK